MEFLFVSPLNQLCASGFAFKLHSTNVLGFIMGLFCREGMASPHHRRLLAITDRAVWLEIHVKKEVLKRVQHTKQN